MTAYNKRIERTYVGRLRSVRVQFVLAIEPGPLSARTNRIAVNKWNRFRSSTGLGAKSESHNSALPYSSAQTSIMSVICVDIDRQINN